MPRRTAVTEATRVQVVQRAPSCGVRSAPASSSTMRPVSHTLINSIRAPIDRVFALLTDPGRIAQWLPGCDGVQSAGPLRKGARFTARFGARQTEFEIVDFAPPRSEEHTSELQSLAYLVCRLLLEKKKKKK